VNVILYELGAQKKFIVKGNFLMFLCFPHVTLHEVVNYFSSRCRHCTINGSADGRKTNL